MKKQIEFMANLKYRECEQGRTRMKRLFRASLATFFITFQLKKFDWAEVLKEAAIFSYICLESAF